MVVVRWIVSVHANYMKVDIQQWRTPSTAEAEADCVVSLKACGGWAAGRQRAVLVSMQNEN
jgi:hypothetical protein